MIGFFSEYFSNSLYNFSLAISKSLPTRYFYLSDCDKKRIVGALEIFEINKNFKRIEECDVLIFSSLELAIKFKGLKTQKGAFLNKFYTSKELENSGIEFGITFFSTLKHYFPIQSIKIEPFVDVDKIEEMRRKFEFFKEKEKVVRILLKNDFEDKIEVKNIITAVSSIFKDPQILIYGNCKYEMGNARLLANENEEQVLKEIVFSDLIIFNTSSPFDLIKALILEKPVMVSSRTLLFEFVKNAESVVNFSDLKEVIKKMKSIIKKGKNKIKEKEKFRIENVANNFLNKLLSIAIKA